MLWEAGWLCGWLSGHVLSMERQKAGLTQLLPLALFILDARLSEKFPGKELEQELECPWQVSLC